MSSDLLNYLAWQAGEALMSRSAQDDEAASIQRVCDVAQRMLRVRRVRSKTSCKSEFAGRKLVTIDATDLPRALGDAGMATMQRNIDSIVGAQQYLRSVCHAQR
jgi:hypothetical protein